MKKGLNLKVILFFLVLKVSFSMDQKPIDGSPVWTTSIAGNIISPLCLSSDHFLYGVGDDKGIHVLKPRGRELWYHRPGKSFSPFLAIGQTHIVYTFTEDGTLLAFSPGGWVLWSHSFKGLPRSNFIIDGADSLYFIDSMGTFRGFNRRGDPMFEEPLSLSKAPRMIFLFNHLFYAYDGLSLKELMGGDELFLKQESVGKGDFLIKDGELFFKNSQGWSVLLQNKLTFVSCNQPPLGSSVVYQKAPSVISWDFHLIRPLDNWSIEALLVDPERINPLFQEGFNPGRTFSDSYKRVSKKDRIADFKKTKEYGFLQLFQESRAASQSTILSKIKGEPNSYLLRKEYPYYDLILESWFTSRAYSESENLPHYERRRELYSLLARWGDYSLRQGILGYLSLEEDPSLQALLIFALGEIGFDPDGRSFKAIWHILDKNQSIKGPSDLLVKEILTASYKIGRYNGGESINKMVEIFTFIGERPISKENRELLSFLLNTF